MLAHRLHRRREPRDRPRPQIIAVREASRHDHHVDARQVGLLVPDEPRVTDSAAGEKRVTLVAGAGELQYAKNARRLLVYDSAGGGVCDAPPSSSIS